MKNASENLLENFGSQVIFNWGYHDGAFDSRRAKPCRWACEDHYSNEYRQGYLVGYAANEGGGDTSDSSDAYTDAVNFGDIEV